MKKFYFMAFILMALLPGCNTPDMPNQEPASGSAVSQQAIHGISKGNIPPDFQITTIDGRQYQLSRFKEQNKPVLLYFWASWCPYCSRDFDAVKGIYPKYADKVAFLAIDLDAGEDAEIIRNYRLKKGIGGIDFAESKRQVLSDYSITHTTTKYAIGRNGLILYKGSGVFNGQQWETLLKGLAES